MVSSVPLPPRGGGRETGRVLWRWDTLQGAVRIEPRRPRARPPALRTLAVAVLAAMLPVQAQDIGEPVGDRLEHPTERLRQQQGEGLLYQLEGAVEYSDNRGRSDRGGDDDILVASRARVDWFRQSRRLRANVEGQFEFLDSFGSVFDDELRARLAATATFALWPERIYWILQDFAGIEPVDSFSAGGHDDLQQTNVFTTGPTFRISPEGLWWAELDARYTRSDAEVTDSFDGERTGGAIRIGHRFDAARSAWIGAEAQDVRYDEPLGFAGRPDLPPQDDPPRETDHERFDAYARYRSAFPRLVVDLAAGHSRIEFTDGIELSGLLARAAMTWLPNEIHAVTARFVREYSDAVRDVASQINALDPLPDFEPRPEIGPAIYLLKSAEATWRYRFRRGQVEVTPYSRDYDYQLEASFLDQEATGTRADFTWLADSRTTFRAALGVERRDFRAVDREDDNLYGGVFVERRFNSRWGMRAGLSRYQRDSSAPGSDFDENVLSVAVVHFGGR